MTALPRLRLMIPTRYNQQKENHINNQLNTVHIQLSGYNKAMATK